MAQRGINSRRLERDDFRRKRILRLSDSFGILRREEVEECAGAAPCVFDGALAGLSQQVLEFGEDRSIGLGLASRAAGRTAARLLLVSRFLRHAICGNRDYRARQCLRE